MRLHLKYQSELRNSIIPRLHMIADWLAGEKLGFRSGAISRGMFASDVVCFRMASGRPREGNGSFTIMRGL